MERGVLALPRGGRSGASAVAQASADVALLGSGIERLPLEGRRILQALAVMDPAALLGGLRDFGACVRTDRPRAGASATLTDFGTKGSSTRSTR